VSCLPNYLILVFLAITGASCDFLSAPGNGRIDCSLGDDGVPTNGDICTFTCDDGFELSGSKKRRCRIRNSRSRWIGNEATCDMLGMTLLQIQRLYINAYAY